MKPSTQIPWRRGLAGLVAATLMAGWSAGAAGTAGTAGTGTTSSARGSDTPAAPSISLAWMVKLPDQNVDGISGNIAESSPIVAKLHGGYAAVVGDTGGYLWAYYLKNGRLVPHWPVSTGTPITGGIDSTPSAAELPGTTHATVFVSSGLPLVNSGMAPYAYSAFSSTGRLLWRQVATDVYGDYGAFAGPTIYGGAKAPKVAAGSFSFNMYGLNSANGAQLWSFNQGDSDYSTAAVGDLFGNGDHELVVGGTPRPIRPSGWPTVDTSGSSTPGVSCCARWSPNRTR